MMMMNCLMMLMKSCFNRKKFFSKRFSQLPNQQSLSITQTGKGKWNDIPFQIIYIFLIYFQNNDNVSTIFSFHKFFPSSFRYQFKNH